MQYKLVLSDLDGTLLSDEKGLLPSTEHTIHELVKLGVLFATVSAKTISYTECEISSLKDVCCANACVNGAFVQTAKGEILVDKPFDEGEVSFLVELCDEMRASFLCVTMDGPVGKVLHPGCEKGFKMHHGTFSDIPTHIDPHMKIYLMPVITENIVTVVEAVRENLPYVEAGPIKSLPGGLGLTFLQRKGTNKAEALSHIADYYHVDLSKILAFGDEFFNDGPMFEMAGCGVAMKNGNDALIKNTKYITYKDNNEDGVGDFLREMFGLPNP